MGQKLSKLVNVYKKYGFCGFCRKLYAYVKANYFDKVSFVTFLRQRRIREQLRELLAGDYDRIVLWRSSFGYNVPLFQRPQHIARNLARERCLVFYEVTTMTDKVKTFRKHEDNLYLFNFNNLLLNRILMSELKQVRRPKYIQVYSTDWKLSKENIENYRANGFGFIYEYIDDLSPELAGTKELPQYITDKYHYAMTHEDVYVVVTAELLRQDVLKHRSGARVAFSSNGVDNSFFQHFDENYRFEPEFQKILNLGKPIVCYYGALAKWFDYDLLKKIAATGKYSVVLFGIRYDESYEENIHGEENIYFMGPRDYKVLKNYARCADILTIPFLINDITRATSPVKIFEYMALQKPIVTTDMNECRKYRSVLIGHDHEEFLAQLDKALSLKNDTAYHALLTQEAEANDWSHKAAAIIEMLKKDEQQA